jgi:O-antigen ligase
MAGLAVIEKIGDTDEARVLIWIQIAACAGLLWMGLQQSAGILPEGGFIGPFNPDAAGVFLALCLPAFFSRKTWPFIGIILAAIILTKTSTGFAAAFAACAVAAFVAPLSGKSKVAALAAIVILAGLFVWKVDPIARTINCDRWIAWGHGTRAAIHAPAGYGLGSWETVFPVMASGDARLGQYFRQAHNEYVQFAFEAGLPAVILTAAFLMFAAWATAKGRIPPHTAGGMAALAVSCAGWHTFHVAPLALIGCAWMGLFLKNAQKGA